MVVFATGKPVAARPLITSTPEITNTQRLRPPQRRREGGARTWPSLTSCVSPVARLHLYQPLNEVNATLYCPPSPVPAELVSNSVTQQHT